MNEVTLPIKPDKSPILKKHRSWLRLLQQEF